jgi:hypothetical protein
MHGLNVAGFATRGKILVSHSGADAESRRHGIYTLSTGKLLLTFRRSLPYPSAGSAYHYTIIH